jgi:photosystem II stability/assembly factor-like uncharacterized protein
MFKTIDGGLTWAARNEGLPEDVYIHSLLIDPRDGEKIYAATSSDYGAVFLSINGGESWSSLHGNLPSFEVNVISLHPENGSIIAGTEGSGAYRRSSADVPSLTWLGFFGLMLFFNSTLPLLSNRRGSNIGS